GLAAPALGLAPVALREAAGLPLGGHRSRKAALALDGGEPRARAPALGLVRAEVARWQHWLEQHHRLALQAPPRQAVREPSTQLITHETAPAPEGGPGGRRITPHVAPARRLSSEAQDRRPGRKRRAKTCHGFQ